MVQSIAYICNHFKIFSMKQKLARYATERCKVTIYVMPSSECEFNFIFHQHGHFLPLKFISKVQRLLKKYNFFRVFIH